MRPAALLLSCLISLTALAQDPMVPHDPSIDMALPGRSIEGTFDVVVESSWSDLGSMTIAPPGVAWSGASNLSPAGSPQVALSPLTSVPVQTSLQLPTPVEPPA